MNESLMQGQIRAQVMASAGLGLLWSMVAIGAFAASLIWGGPDWAAFAVAGLMVLTIAAAVRVGSLVTLAEESEVTVSLWLLYRRADVAERTSQLYALAAALVAVVAA
jgi:hypothetical protein